tara:strand:+ start:196 stop:1815 length:1620 start_codon:yes stop_codon:yes gene_type:complete
MHPGGTNIIKSNGGVDCTKSFDLLAHTNNPEVSSLLTKYYIGELSPKPAYHVEELGMLYDLWKDYLRTATEQVVASHFEVGMIMESSIVWFQGDLFNMGGVRRFYHYQSRLLQGGFSALFGAKLQELYLKLSYTLANSTSSSDTTRLPDVLGVIARAKGSTNAVTSANEIGQVGQFTCNSESARHHEKGIIAYAQRSVQFDMEFLEAIREEACAGMDALDTIMDLDVPSEADRLTALCHFLMQLLHRMANRLEGFYARLARYSVFHPELEHNPARARWNILKRKVLDGSFFLLARQASMIPTSDQVSHRAVQRVDFNQVISQVETTLNLSSAALTPARKMDLNEQHAQRAMSRPSGPPAYEQHNQAEALRAMSAFIDSNRKAIRRLSKMPPSIDMAKLAETYGTLPHTGNNLPTPPSSRSSSTSRHRSNSAVTAPKVLSHTSPATNMVALMAKMNSRLRDGVAEVTDPSPPQSANGADLLNYRSRSMHSFPHPSTPYTTDMDRSPMTGRARSATGNLRSFRLQASAMAGGMNRRGAAAR